MKGPIPDRWLDYSAVGKVIDGTRFIAFKVPLKEELCKTLPDNQRFTPHNLKESIQDLKLVIDLTNTKRYYNPMDLGSVAYQKIFCEGHKIPNRQVVDKFQNVVEKFFASNSTGLIGVHCTHGLNRTGYLVCRYLIEKLRLEPAAAIQKFEDARGHKMERANYLNHLRSLPQSPEVDVINKEGVEENQEPPHNNRTAPWQRDEWDQMDRGWHQSDGWEYQDQRTWDYPDQQGWDQPDGGEYWHRRTGNPRYPPIPPPWSHPAYGNRRDAPYPYNRPPPLPPPHLAPGYFELPFGRRGAPAHRGAGHRSSRRRPYQGRPY